MSEKTIPVMKNEKNEAMYQRAIKCIAGGQLSNYKSHEGRRPVYMDHVEGAHLFDIDGNMRYDFSLNFGPAILGQSNERLKKAVCDQVMRCYTNHMNEVQIESAEKIKACIPGMELLRFGLSGSEVDMMAVRTARGYTGKNMVVKFAGHYHGAYDFIIGGVAVDPENPVAMDIIREGDAYSAMTTTKGRARHALDDTYVIEYNDLPAMKKLFEDHGDDIACVIMEPIPVNIHGCNPLPGYLEGVRELCTKHNVVLIFDEVITGFRLNIGGAAAHFGVIPDLWTFSKALGGGFPAGAFGGKKEIMDTITRCEVLSAGSFPGHPVIQAAVSSVIDQLRENDCAILKHIARLGTMLGEGFKKMADKNGVPMVIQGFPGAIVPVFTEKERIINNADALKNADLNAYWYFSARMNALGITNLQRYSVGAAHTEADVQHAIEMADIALAEIAEKQKKNWAE